MASFIVVVSPSYGGAEKRFFDIFTSLRRGGAQVNFIAPSSLVDRLKADNPDRQDVLGALMPVTMVAWSRLGFMHRFAKLLRSLPRGSSFHYPMNCLWPLHLGRGDRLSVSMVDCERVPSLFGGTLTSAWSWLSFYAVQRIDVLSPMMLRAMRHYRAVDRMSLTPGGTYVVPPAVGAGSKTATVVFLSRFVTGKGVDDLLDVLPQVWARLRDVAPPDCRFQIAGYGPLQPLVESQVASLRGSGVPVDFLGYSTADALMARAAVVLSMQKTTNYPSRVVAEALMAGCGAIVRDTGDSREFGSNLPGLLYCQAELNADELARQIAELLNRVLRETGCPIAISKAAHRRFSSPEYIDYFRRLIVAGSTGGKA